MRNKSKPLSILATASGNTTSPADAMADWRTMPPRSGARAARSTVGPLPMLRPYATMRCGATPQSSTRYANAASTHSTQPFSEGSPPAKLYPRYSYASTSAPLALAKTSANGKLRPRSSALAWLYKIVSRRARGRRVLGRM